MKANFRSICGAMLLLVIIPILAGLLACLPVPIGDPERSRIDPEMSGWWIVEMEDGDVGLALFRPYDKRTWLVMMVSLDKGDVAEIDDFSVETAGDLVALLRNNKVGRDGVVGTFPTVYKAWLARLGGRRFMTWEPVAQIEDTKNFLPDVWLVFGVTGQTEDGFSLAMLDAEYEAFDGLVEAVRDETDGGDVEVWKVRKRWERVIRKHADDPELYGNDVFRYRRLPGELESKAARLIAWPFNY